MCDYVRIHMFPFLFVFDDRLSSKRKYPHSSCNQSKSISAHVCLRNTHHCDCHHLHTFPQLTTFPLTTANELGLYLLLMVSIRAIPHKNGID